MASPATTADIMAAVNKVGDARSDILGAGGANTASVLANANTNASLAAQTACGDTAMLTAGQERSTYHTGSALERSTYHTGSAVDRGFFETRVGQGANMVEIKNNEVAVAVAAGANARQMADGFGLLALENRRVKSEIADLFGVQALANQLHISNTTKELGLQAASNSAAIQLQAANNAAIAGSESAKQFALAAVAAAQNAKDIQLQLANCCCEIKETVNCTAGATQALIQAQSEARVRDSLAAAQQENLILRLSHERH